FPQPVNAQVWPSPVGRPVKIPRLPKHRIGTRRKGLRDVGTTVATLPGIGGKRIARAHPATIVNQRVNFHAQIAQCRAIELRRPQRRQIQRIQGGSRNAHVISLTSGILAGGGGSSSIGVSGATPRARSAAEVTAANTGAATLPP